MSLSRPFLTLSRRTYSARPFAPKSNHVASSSRLLSTTNSDESGVNLTTLVESIAEEHEMTKAESKRIITSVFNQITEAVANKKRVSIHNFGTFECVHVKSRSGRNPKTGEPLTIPASEKVKFKAYSYLKDYVNKPPK